LEDRGDQSGKDLNTNILSSQKGFPLYAFVVCLLLAMLAFAISWIGLPIFSTQHYEKSLSQLRGQSQSLEQGFAEIIQELAERHTALSASEIPPSTQERFEFLKSLCPQPGSQGFAYYDEYGDLELWYGQIIDIRPIFGSVTSETSFVEQKSSIMIRHKASVYMASFQELRSGAYVVFYRLLAFLPQLQAHYLKDFHLIPEVRSESCDIDYQDFRDDVSGTENFFARHDDEYIGQPRLQDAILTLYFPLRNENGRLMATVTLRSLSPPAKLALQKENVFLLFHLFFGLALVFLLVLITRLSADRTKRNPVLSLLPILIIAAIRGLFLTFSSMEKIQSWPAFSPTEASFIPAWNLTKSPADIFLTSLFLFLIVYYMTQYLLRPSAAKRSQSNQTMALVLGGASLVMAFGMTWLLHRALLLFVFHSRFHLLDLSPQIPYLLIQAGIFLFFSTQLLLLYSVFRKSLQIIPRARLVIFLFIPLFSAYILILSRSIHPLILVLHGTVIFSVGCSAYLCAHPLRKQAALATFCGAIFLVFCTINQGYTQKNRSLLQNSLKTTIVSQQDWGRFLLQQSFQEIEKRGDKLISLFLDPKASDLAAELWQNTLLAKFNWNSSLEIISSENELLSRFALNIPELYRPQLEFSPSREWVIQSTNITYWRKEKDFLIGYRDWHIEGTVIGRTIIALSVDYEMLPFLYSGAPYFELLRIASYPSLDQIDLKFAIFDHEGRLLFNPDDLSSGISQPLLSGITAAEDHLWMSFTDGENRYRSLFFSYQDRVYAILLPKKTLLNHAVGFLKLFILYSAGLLILLAAFRLISRNGTHRFPLWSFAGRVYISFVAIALIPLLLFTFSTRSFLSTFFSQKVMEEAESQANFAHRALENFIVLQQEEQVSLTIPPVYLVHWISSTINNDVNLYLDGRIASSSHLEFFDYGLLPELIDGEIFYKIQYENNPFYAQSQRIGDYSFHTLTVPYYFQDNFLLISLPFPLEQEEISRSTADLIEFLIFVSAFFIVLVLLFARAAGGTIISPIRKLLAGTKEVSLGNLEVSIPYPHEDEMKTLIEGFNSMVKSLKKHQLEIAELGKKAAWAEMARKVAHDIKNPLTPIQLSAEHLLRVYEEKPKDFENALQESTSYIVKEVENLRKIAQEFLETSKDTMMQKTEFDLRSLIQETVAPYKKVLEKRIQISDVYAGEDFLYRGDREKIKIVFRNILTNAIESLGEQGRIDIRAAAADSGFELEIVDTGSGLEQEMLDRIFDPYFSTKDAGTGLGLPIAKKIIADHQGRIQAELNRPQGLRIRISLPRIYGNLNS
jgi:signal transduction histidine kinase